MVAVTVCLWFSLWTIDPEDPRARRLDWVSTLSYACSDVPAEERIRLARQCRALGVDRCGMSWERGSLTIEVKIQSTQ